MDVMTSGYLPVIEEISGFKWSSLDRVQLTAVARAYWYFSIQFRENLQIALSMHPDDAQLQSLVREECATDNLSPWPGVATSGEQMNHDEFMRRLLRLSPVDPDQQVTARTAGRRYLSLSRQADDLTRAMSIASYECGGLECIFREILRARHWDTPLLAAFRHFLGKHVEFDSDPEQGHGALIRHLVPDDRIRCLWVGFRDLLLTSVPQLV